MKERVRAVKIFKIKETHQFRLQTEEIQTI